MKEFDFEPFDMLGGEPVDELELTLTACENGMSEDKLISIMAREWEEE